MTVVLFIFAVMVLSVTALRKVKALMVNGHFLMMELCTFQIARYMTKSHGFKNIK